MAQRDTTRRKLAAAMPRPAEQSARADWRACLGGDGTSAERQSAHPQQPHDQHVEHDQSLPDIEVRPLKHAEIPLAQIEEAYDSNDVEPLHRDNAERQTEKLAIPRRGKRKNRGDEHDRGFDSVAPCLDGDREAVAGAPQDLALGDDLRIEKLDEIRRDRRQCISPRNDKPLLYPGSQLEAEKPRL